MYGNPVVTALYVQNPLLSPLTNLCLFVETLVQICVDLFMDLICFFIDTSILSSVLHSLDYCSSVINFVVRYYLKKCNLASRSSMFILSSFRRGDFSNHLLVDLKMYNPPILVLLALEGYFTHILPRPIRTTHFSP